MAKRSSMMGRMRASWRRQALARLSRSVPRIPPPTWAGLETLEARVLLSGALPSAGPAVPALFIENAGQWSDASIRYASLGEAANILHTDAGPVLQLLQSDAQTGRVDAAAVAIRFDQALTVQPVGEQASDSRYNFLLGDTAYEGLAAYASVVYPGLYEGIDLVTFAQPRNLKYEFHLAAGADPGQIRVQYDGGVSLAVDAAGQLLVTTPAGTLVDDAPIAYQEVDGQRVAVAVEFVLLDPTTYGFAVTGDYDANLPLVIDPEIGWSTYLGGADASDEGLAVATDNDGNFYVAGRTLSATFPGTGQVPQGTGGDGFVAKFNPDHTLAWATYLGGGLEDVVTAMVVGPATGKVYLTGTTLSTNFPTTAGAADSTANGGVDAFVTELNPQGGLVWSTYLGGAGDDYGRGIALDGNAKVAVVGNTRSTDFRTSSAAYDASYNGDILANGLGDGFVTKLNAAGAVEWSTYLGSVGSDQANDVVFDTLGDLYVVGETLQPVGTTTFPTTSGAYDQSPNGQSDAFVSKFASSGSLAWSTLLGGSFRDLATGVAVDASRNVYVGGYGASNFPRTDDAFQQGGNAFAAKLNPTGSTLLYSTLLPGFAELPAVDSGQYLAPVDLALDRSNNIWLAGVTTNPSGFSEAVLEQAFDDTFAGPSEGYVHGLLTGSSTAAYTLGFTTFYGGSGADSANAITVDADGNIFVAGTTASTNLPMGQNPYDGTLNAGSAAFTDAFILQFLGVSPEMVVLGEGPLGDLKVIANGDDLPEFFDATHFGSLPVNLGATATQRFTIRNDGDFLLDLTGNPRVQFVGENSTDFTLVATPTANVAGDGATTTFSVRFSPLGIGRRSTIVTIPSSDPDIPAYTFRIEGRGTAAALPEIEVFGNELPIASGDSSPGVSDNTDFGSVDVQTGARVQDLLVLNQGGKELIFAGIPPEETPEEFTPAFVISGPHAADFTIIEEPASPLTQRSLGGQTLGIRFDPSALGLRTATVTIYNNDTDEAVYTFAIQGTGVDTTAPVATIASISPDPRGDAVSQAVIVFSEPVTGLDRADLRLVRDAVNIALPASVTVSSADGGVTWTVANLTGLTGTGGAYTLSLLAAGSGIVDASGNPLAADTSDSWTLDRAAPIAGALAASPQPALQGQAVTFTATGVADPSGVSAVQFFREVNGDNIPNLPELLGDGVLQSDGSWTFTTTVTWGAGNHRYYARPIDVFNNAGNFSVAQGSVVIPPTTTVNWTVDTRSVTFLEPEADGGTTVTVTLNGLVGNLVFDGTATVTDNAGDIVVTPGPDWRGRPRLDITGASPTGAITFRTVGGDGDADLAGVIANGPIGSLSAPTMNLVDDGIVLTGAGVIASISLRDLREGADILMPGTTGVTAGLAISAAYVNAGSDIVVGLPIRSLTVGQYDAGGSVTAPAITSLTTAADKKRPILLGHFSAGLNLGQAGNAPETMVLSAARIAGEIRGGTWNLTGSAGTLQIGSATSAWSFLATGDVSRLQFTRDGAGNLTARSLAQMTVGRDLKNATLTLTREVDAQNQRVLALGKLSVKGLAERVSLLSQGSLGSLTFGRMLDTVVFAGASSSDGNGDGVLDLPSAVGAFTADARIDKLTVKGVKDRPFAYENSSIAAAFMGRISLTKVDTSNEGKPFGLAARLIDGYRFTPGRLRTDPIQANDFAVRLSDLE